MYTYIMSYTYGVCTLLAHAMHCPGPGQGQAAGAGRDDQAALLLLLG